ncbi:MAG: hypothetical protein LZF85_06665 [Nitrosomonas sp.]|uniref:hypothetical protein n=1 Tax=Nitrosomonas sp. TaxID=42353 RepID=UPI0025E578F0|nr:hypothetical protein [Nitrosomonas sp.]UJP04105.1 MAG: hypothetical protein LZF85_06665 [Nitrosomonas sp.]
MAHLSVIPAQAGIQWFCFTPEIECLKALQQVNPNVRDEEIQFFKQQLQQLTGALKLSNLRLDAVRVIVAT